jgi:hypothetical protein
MNLYEAPVTTVAEFLRWIKALGSHRYVAGSLHMVHALVYDACAEAVAPESVRWAREVLGSGSAFTGDTQLRRASDAELLQMLEAVLTRGDVRERLAAALRAHTLDVQQLGAGFLLFDEAREPTLSPVLIDAGWELLSLDALDADRHRGVLDRMPSETVVAPHAVPVLQELGLFGAEELLLFARDDGGLASAPPLWLSEPQFYQDYVLHGVSRAAKLATW